MPRLLLTLTLLLCCTVPASANWAPDFEWELWAQSQHCVRIEGIGDYPDYAFLTLFNYEGRTMLAWLEPPADGENEFFPSDSWNSCFDGEYVAASETFDFAPEFTLIAMPKERRPVIELLWETRPYDRYFDVVWEILEDPQTAGAAGRIPLGRAEHPVEEPPNRAELVHRITGIDGEQIQLELDPASPALIDYELEPGPNDPARPEAELVGTEAYPETLFFAGLLSQALTIEQVIPGRALCGLLRYHEFASTLVYFAVPPEHLDAFLEASHVPDFGFLVLDSLEADDRWLMSTLRVPLEPLQPNYSADDLHREYGIAELTEDSFIIEAVSAGAPLTAERHPIAQGPKSSTFPMTISLLAAFAIAVILRPKKSAA